MKKFFIICTVIFIAVFSQITFVSCENMYVPNIPDNYEEYLKRYDLEANGYNAVIRSIDYQQKQLDYYRKCLEEKGKPKIEILKVLRTNSSFVMNNPAYYNRTVNNNTIVESGKCADEEDIYMLYLSDGKIIKSSPRNKPSWFGTKVGEKVRKTTYYVIKAHDNAFKLDTIVDYTPLYE